MDFPVVRSRALRGLYFKFQTREIKPRIAQVYISNSL